MSLETDKIEIARFILETEDEGLIKRVKETLGDTNNDWYDSLPDKIKAYFNLSLQQLENNETLSHEEAMAEIEKWERK